MKRLYALLVLWLITPALDLRERLDDEFTEHVTALCKSWGFSGLFHASAELSGYWRERGCPGGLLEAIRRGLTGPNGRANES